MYNKVILIGNLTRDVEFRHTQNGTALAKFGLATNRIYLDPITKEKKRETMFIDIVVFGRSAETAHQWLSKGKKVLIEGRLILDQWTGPDGQKRSKHSVVAEKMQFMDSKSSDENYDSYQSQAIKTPQQNRKTPPTEIGEQDIPF